MNALSWIVTIGLMVVLFQLFRVGTRLLLDWILPSKQLKITYVDEQGTSHSVFVDSDDDIGPLLVEAKKVSRRNQVRAK
ncbi:hypothetical protein BCU94_06880 [Shewanella sp. 10N.286.52.C2]|uniref:hypothetical protein n=1 Tax=Shewanella sp. 10N.286.52.C2 TaxID=1880838 RepID=UPI000C85CC31|nr:hypothetical protein [Shewanella sp. 10N.286.52.C2]PMG31892.1 hypothetical protein BCU94_06880 [Shewanella sp. 10N.286.52.C2]